MKQCEIRTLYNLEETIAADLFQGLTYPWEALPRIGSFILELGEKLDPEEYEKKGEHVWIAKSAKVAPTAFIAGPAIIGEKRGDPSLRLHPGQRPGRRRGGSGKLHGAEKRSPV